MPNSEFQVCILTIFIETSEFAYGSPTGGVRCALFGGCPLLPDAGYIPFDQKAFTNAWRQDKLLHVLDFATITFGYMNIPKLKN